jgi:uncharacterized protein YdiU (UPF0061 family)
MTEGKAIIDKYFYNVYDWYYYEFISKRLGFIKYTSEIKVLIDDLFELLEDFGYDMSFFFRALLILIDKEVSTSHKEEFSKCVFEYTLEYGNKIQKIKPSIPEEKLEQLIQLSKGKI